MGSLIRIQGSPVVENCLEAFMELLFLALQQKNAGVSWR